MDIESIIVSNVINNKKNKTLQSQLQSIPISRILHIPKTNCFGVFVSIRRSIPLQTYPNDIHGCIGYWSHNYTVLSKTEIVSHLMDVSLSAMYSDKRKDYFPPINTDPNAIIEIDFMMLPLIPIDSKTGILTDGTPFKNSKYGLIVEGKNKSTRATYLPHVFPDTTPWAKLKGDLISKAGASNNSNQNGNQFMAYTIKQLTKKLGKM
jgi:AMMECR1 domain-containing protein